jgi:hypothetical protein
MQNKIVFFILWYSYRSMMLNYACVLIADTKFTQIFCKFNLSARAKEEILDK